MIQFFLRLLLLFEILALAANIANASDVYFNQNAMVFRQSGLKTESLCGPVSFLNWLQYIKSLHGAPALAENEALQILTRIQSLHHEAIDHGLTSNKAISFLESALKSVDLDNRFKPVNIPLSKDIVFSQTPALILIRTSQILKQRSLYDFDQPIYKNSHYVLRISANTDSISFIDPEAPDQVTTMEVEMNSQPHSNLKWLLQPFMDKPALIHQRPPGIPTESTIVAIIEMQSK